MKRLFFAWFAIKAAMAVTGGAPIRVVVANADAVPAGLLAKAEQTAGLILSQAGVAVSWETPPPLDGLRLQIVDRELLAPHDRATGYAVLMPRPDTRESYAVISLPAVLRAASTLDAHPAIVLGASIAHEIGHVLLGTNEHSPGGIMSPHLGRQHFRKLARGELFFTAAEAKRLRKTW